MSLYHLERDGDVDALVDHLETSESDSVRRRSAELLGEVAGLDDQAAVDALVAAATDDESEAVRDSAIDALDQLGQPALEALLSELPGIDVSDGQADWAAAEGFVSALDSDRAELRMAAANALGRLGNAKTLPQLIERLDDESPRVRARAARAIGTIGAPKGVPPLAKRLDAPNVDVRREVADALAAIGTDGAVEALVSHIDDESPEIRHVVVSAIGEVGDPRPLDALIEALQDENGVVRRTAVFSIIELLSSAPTDRSHALRESVVERLRQTDDESVVGPLVDILENTTEAGPRRNAAWLLGRVAGDEHAARVADALADALDDDDRMTVQFATTSLVEIGGSVVERRMLSVIDEDRFSPGARAKAVFVLGKVGGDRARDRLSRLVDRADDDSVRKQAFSALSKLGGRA
jgi:HEAT repeat protein